MMQRKKVGRAGWVLSAAEAATQAAAWVEKREWTCQAADKHYDQQRRSVDFAIQAASQREARLSLLVVEAAGICVGSRPRVASDPPPDASWNNAGP